VLVFHDLLGLFDAFTPKFVRRYAELGPQIQVAVEKYCSDVRQRAFPDETESYEMTDDEWQKFRAIVDDPSAGNDLPSLADDPPTGNDMPRLADVPSGGRRR
jgi:3-methyl-2-oxobutanoate hydroxymethyltransferase